MNKFETDKIIENFIKKYKDKENLSFDEEFKLALISSMSSLLWDLSHGNLSFLENLMDIKHIK